MKILNLELRYSYHHYQLKMYNFPAISLELENIKL